MHEVKTQEALDVTKRQLVAEALARILATDKFECSPQMTAFLRYVVDETVEGHQSRIKAFSVAVDALGKPNSFDPQNDPVVRVLAGRLRTALSAYNSQHPNAPVVISMRKGSYVPMFSGPAIEGNDPGASTPNKRAANSAHSDNNVQIRAANVDQRATAQNMSHSAHTHAVDEPDIDIASTEPQDALTPAPRLNSETMQANRGVDGIVNRFFNSSRAKWSFAALLFASFGFMQIIPAGTNSEPTLQALRMGQAAEPQYRQGAKPAAPTVFISAISNGNEFEDDLNTIVSGALSANTDINIRRILVPEQSAQFWREDYILTLASLPIENETRVNIQLIEAATGLVLSSEPVTLQLQDNSQITKEGLLQIIEAAKTIVCIEGPLFNRYNDLPG